MGDLSADGAGAAGAPPGLFSGERIRNDRSHPSPADEARQGIRLTTVAFGAVLLAADRVAPIAGALGMNSLINPRLAR